MLSLFLTNAKVFVFPFFRFVKAATIITVMTKRKMKKQNKTDKHTFFYEHQHTNKKKNKKEILLKERVYWL